MKTKTKLLFLCLFCLGFLYLKQATLAMAGEEAAAYGITDGSAAHDSSAWVDVDGDGDLDLYSVNLTTNNKLYQNNGVGQAFTDVTSTYGVADGTTFHIASAWVDVDNDGDFDLYSINVNSDNKLYINNGPGQAFTDATATYDLAVTGFNHTGAQWVDIDNDGDLDLYSTNFDANNKLYQNNGVGQTFTDVTSTYGIADGTTSHTSTAWIDIDNDGDMDLYSVNNLANNKLYQNNGVGQAFTDVTSTYGIADGTTSHGSSAWGDFDNDGDLDLYLSNSNVANKLYQNNGVGQTFTDATATYDVGVASDNRSADWVDVDSDGDLDLYSISYGTVNNLYKNQGVGQTMQNSFCMLAFPWCADYDTYTATYIDFNNDGYLDYYLSVVAGNNLFYIANGGSNHYLKVNVENNNGLYQYNSRVEVDIDGNGDFSSSGSLLTSYQTNSSYSGASQIRGSQDPVGVFFGLGSDSSCNYDVRVFLPGVSPSASPSYSWYNVCPDQTLTTPFDTVAPLVTLTASDPTGDSTPSISGTATDAKNLISSVEYQMDGTAGSWSACTADDGAFDEVSENFTCNVSPAISEDTHTIYARATDSNFNTTSSGSEASDSFTVDITFPASFSLDYPSGYCSNCTKPTLVFKKSESDDVSSYSVYLDQGKNRNFSITGLPASGDGTSPYVWKDDNVVKVEYLHEDDSDFANDEIKVYFKCLESSTSESLCPAQTNGELTEGKHTWKANVYDAVGNETSSSHSFYLDKTQPSISNLAIADAFMVSPHGEFKLAFTNRMPSFSGKAIDVYQGSESSNNNGTTDIYDEVSSGPDAITINIQKLGRGKTPQSADPDYTDHLTEELKLSKIKDDSGNEKYVNFYLPLSQPLVNGYYKVNLKLKDQAGNTYDYSPFYLSLNYNRPLIFPPGQMKTEKINEETIPSTSEKRKRGG